MNIDRKLVKRLLNHHIMGLSDLLCDFKEALNQDDIKIHFDNGG